MNAPGLSAERIFQTARTKRESKERAAYLEGACGEDLGLRAKVDALLKADTEARESASHVRPAPVIDPLADPAALSTVASTRGGGEHAGNIVGRYKLLELIGEGGFGAVWMAEQREPVKRRVALKIIKLGMDTKQTLARFEVERQALAMMDHSNIARVLDAGATETGRPYFVMELVRGVPITDYCDTEKLDTAQRLDLFIQVCNAVQHAHQKGIIHRDLKPSNVLVTLHDGVPVPKIIDFGIAKATHAELTEKTLFTEHRQMIGTPAYMSPEQAEMSGLDIDTRTDIYSLGVLLYELLTGTTPFDPQQLKSAGYNELVRILREEEPHRPSNRLSEMRSEPGPGSTSRSEYTARQHGTDPKTLARRLKGDLDWIVMKCLEKDRQRRYDTANGLAMDIRRHLTNEPIVARPPSTTYRIRKFARRNKALVIGSSLVAVVLILGIVGTSLGFARAVRERDRTKEAEEAATERAAEAEAVTDFLTNMLAAADPSESGKDVLVRQVIDQASKTIADPFRDQPLVEARLRAAMGKTYFSLGLFQDAQAHLTAALETRKRLLGEDHVDTIRSMTALATLNWRAGRIDEAKTINEQALEHARRALGEEHPDTLKAEFLHANLLRDQNKYDEVLPLHNRVLDIRRRVLGREHADTILSMNAVGNALSDLERREEAAAIYTEALSIQRRRFGEDHPTTLTLTSNLAMQNAVLKREFGRLPEKLRHLENCKRVLGDEHFSTLGAMTDVAYEYQWTGRLREALEVFERVLAARRRTLGEENRFTVDAMANVASVYHDAHRNREAAQLFERVVELRRRVLEAGHARTLRGLEDLADIYMDLGRAEDSHRVARERLEILRRRSEQAGATANDHNDYAWWLLIIEPVDLRDPATALPIARRACESARVSNNDALGIYLDTLAKALDETGDRGSAIQTQEEAVARLRPKNRLADEIKGRLAELYWRAGRLDDLKRFFLSWREELRATSERNPDDGQALMSYAILLNPPDWGTVRFEELWEPAEAIRVMERAMPMLEQRKVPWRAYHLRDLAALQDQTGNPSAAVQTMERAISLMSKEDTDIAEFMGQLASFLFKLGRMDEARQWSSRRLEYLRPLAESDEAIRSELRGYAEALLEAEPEDLRDPAKALPFAQRASARAESTGSQLLWNCLGTLALAQFDTGDVATAVATQERAVTLCHKATPDCKKLEERLAKFQAALAGSSTDQPGSP